MARDLAIVLNNGSINSAVTTAIAAQKYRPVLLHAEIGQSGAGSRSRAAYDLQVAHFKPYREHTLAMPYFSHMPRAQQQQTSVSDPRLPSQIAPQLIELVPIIAAGIRFAVHYEAAAIYIGMRVGPQTDDLAQASEYTQVWNELIQLPCHQAELEVFAPIMELEAWQVIDLGFQVGAPFDRTWSCIEETSEPCWACHGCKTREHSFMQAAKADPMRVVRKV